MNQRLGKKNRTQKPDEVFSYGPFQMARFGRHIAYQSNWKDEDFVEMQERVAAHLPKVTAEIDALVASISSKVAKFEPRGLLYHSWWGLAQKLTKIEAEVDIGPDEATALRMVDYVQSLVASVAPVGDQRQITEPEWDELKGEVENLFFKVNFEYQMSATAVHRKQPGYDHQVEEFKFKAQLYWANVRGHRYQNHDPEYVREVFLPHSAVINELWGITGQQFVDGLIAIWHKLSFGLRDTMTDVASFHKDVIEAIEKKIMSEPADASGNFKQLMAAVVRENGWEERGRRAMGGLFALDMFDLRQSTQFPDALLEELSWSPGGDAEFFAPGEFAGWPLRIWPITKRPFIKLSDGFYCFDISSLFDNIYRVMQRLILRLKPDYSEIWKIQQTAISENLPVQYFRQLLPGAKVWQAVFYKGDIGNGKQGWCESDAIIAYEDHLFVLECRGGAFTYTAPVDDFDAYVASLKNLILKPATQGERFLNYLKSADTVTLYDKDQNAIGALRSGDFRHVVICPITLDSFTELAAQVQHLKKIGVDVGAAPVWALSLDDLRVYADIFDKPLQFLHYVEKRIDAFRSDIIANNDELDHLGLYLEHNNYAVHAKDVQDCRVDRITFNGYRARIDKFFRERMFDPTFPCPLRQEVFWRYDQIIDFLGSSARAGRAKAASYLLNFSGENRKGISDYIVGELAEQPYSKRAKPLTIHGAGSITIYCRSRHAGPRNEQDALLHTRAAMLAGEETAKLLLELQYDEAGSITDAWWTWVDRKSIPGRELARVLEEAEKLRVRRLKKVAAEIGKIGRNDLCPCASGKKYKKCCMPA